MDVQIAVERAVFLGQALLSVASHPDDNALHARLEYRRNSELLRARYVGVVLDAILCTRHCGKALHLFRFGVNAVVLRVVTNKTGIDRCGCVRAGRGNGRTRDRKRGICRNDFFCYHNRRVIGELTARLELSCFERKVLCGHFAAERCAVGKVNQNGVA